MKTLLILLICLPLVTSAQRRDTIPKYNRTSGEELMIAGKRGGLGALMVFGGGAVIVMAQGSKDVNATFQVMGGAISIIGVILVINGWSHISKAGIILNERKLRLTFNEGIGIRYRI